MYHNEKKTRSGGNTGTRQNSVCLYLSEAFEKRIQTNRFRVARGTEGF
ncbi:hypothetical protein AGMMS49983_22190 [Clostridia bacterium]|nr:hypothetical protein AGMMS49983_22190 [Clostridia bacterium]